MRETTRRSRALVATVACLALAATACGSDTPGATGDGPAGDVTGTVLVAGSSTVGPISELVSEDFTAVNPDVTAPVEITGTGGGFKDRFCVGETVINNASRPMKDEEIELCASNGIENILELKVAIDGMTVLTSHDNDSGITCLNTAEIYGLVGPESAGVANWSDANEIVAAVGGGHNASLPEVPLTTAGPGTESGTYDSFWELAIEEIQDARIEEGAIPDDGAKFRPDWTGNNDDNVIIQGIAGNAYSFGWVGFAYFTEVGDQVKALEVADGDGNCVAPTPETIASNEYPLSRDLYFYVNLDALETEDGPAIEGYVDYFLSDAGYDLVAEAGYVNLADDAWDATVAAWEARTANV